MSDPIIQLACKSLKNADKNQCKSVGPGADPKKKNQ